MQKPAKFSIPKPCHENWNAMTPAEKGRYCSLCDKVVRDFTQHTAEEIVAELSKVEGEVCGWVPTLELTPTPFAQAVVWMQYPSQRLRLFLLAFLAVFGMELWGAQEAQATHWDWNQFRNELQTEQGFANYLTDLNQEEVNLKGKVMDAEFGGPVEYASVVVYYKDQLIAGTYTDAEGQFQLSFDAKLVDYQAFTVKVGFLGNEVVQENVAPDVAEMMVFVQTGVTMDEVHISIKNAPLTWPDSLDFTKTFIVQTGGVIVSDCGTIHALKQDRMIGRWYGGSMDNLNDQIQMNHSDMYYREGGVDK